MERSNTEDNLNIITNRNRGKRSSLVFSDDFKNSSSEDEQLKLDELPDETPKIPIENIKAKLDSIDQTYKEVRLRKVKPGQKKDLSEASIYRSQFGDIQFLESATTILDSENFKKSQFYGVYILFWLATGFLLFNNLIHAYLEIDEPFYNLAIVKILRTDLFKIALTDLAMYLSTYFAFLVQILCQKNIISWRGSGWLIQGVYDFFFLLFWSVFASELVLDYPWIARVFLMLHSLVFLMKMHSYGFYNGYLWTITEELKFSEQYLERCTIDNPHLTDEKEVEKYRKLLTDSIKFCKFELSQQAKCDLVIADPNVVQDLPPVYFPDNITLKNFFEYTMYPTVVYTLNFPRTKRIRKWYVFEKVTAVFGIFFLMIVVAQNWLYPLVLKAQASKDLPFGLKSQQYFLVLLDMIPPFLLEYLFTFFIIWEFILNVIAELSRFADRDFYGPWWSCTDWGEFARIWNRPVHKFLLRHVYHSSISAIKLNKHQASLFTFVLSSLVHELVMFSIFRTLRGYLLLFQMSQLPMMVISQTKYFRDKKVLGNVICWVGFISGPSIICTLYLFY